MIKQNLIDYLGFSKDLSSHIDKYEIVMLELKGLKIDKKNFLINILENKKGLTEINDVENILNYKSDNLSSIVDEVNGVISKINFEKCIKADIIDQNNYFFKKIGSEKGFIKSLINDDCSEIFTSKIYSFFSVNDLNILSDLIHFSDIAPSVVTICSQKGLILIVGVKILIGVINRFGEDNDFLKNIFIKVRNSIYLTKVGLYCKKLFTDVRFYIFIGGVSIGIFNYYNSKIIVTEIILPKNEVINPINTIKIAESIEAQIDPFTIKEGQGKAVVSSIKGGLGKAGFALGQIISAPVQGFYIGSFKPLIDYIIEVLKGDNKK
jgi:hypothetical protein